MPVLNGCMAKTRTYLEALKRLRALYLSRNSFKHDFRLQDQTCQLNRTYS